MALKIGLVTIGCAALIEGGETVASGATGATGGAAAAAAQPIRPAHGRPFVPSTGDWEGVWHGFPASFKLVYYPRYFGTGRYAAYAFENVVLVEPASCPLNPSSTSDGVVGENFRTPLREDGSFGLNPRQYGFTGLVTGSHSARITSRYDFPRGPGTPGCKGRLDWRLRPAHRTGVDDGTWKLRFADGEKERFTVHGGGRLMTGLSTPNKLSRCSGVSATINQFIAANGVATDNDRLDGFRVSLKFRRRHATGTLTAATASCGQLRLALSATH